MIRKVRSHHQFMMSYTRVLLSSFSRPVFTFLLFLSGTFILLGAALFHWVEFGQNSKLQSFLDSLYFTVTTMTGVGFGDIVPVSPLGKFLSMGLMLLGTGVFVSFTAVLASSLIELEAEMNEKDHSEK